CYSFLSAPDHRQLGFSERVVRGLRHMPHSKCPAL
ncbi:MAG: hypothetical protein ACI9GK_003407, partial [Devosia sp.]